MPKRRTRGKTLPAVPPVSAALRARCRALRAHSREFVREFLGGDPSAVRARRLDAVRDFRILVRELDPETRTRGALAGVYFLAARRNGLTRV